MAPVKTEEAVANPVLSELVTWVQTLKTVGVSPDKAVEVARDFFLAAACSEEEGEEWEYEDGEEDDEE
ncbi:MAG TPA: hypothetical protein V6D22_04870 [Candidatus Obscuribacterales bacterium]